MTTITDMVQAASNPVSIVAQLEQALVQRLAAAFTPPDGAQPSVEVSAWADEPRAYGTNHPAGACLVIYRGSSFSATDAISGQLLAWQAEFEVSVLAREHQSAEADAPGAHGLLHIARAALLGWRPDQSAAALRLQREALEDYADGVWRYSLRIGVPMVSVAPVEDARGPWIDAGCADEPRITRVTYEPGDDGAHAVQKPQP